MRIETIDSGEEQLGLRLEDVVNDDGEGSDDMGGDHPSVGLSGHGNSTSIPTQPSGQAQSAQGAPMLSQDPDSSHTQQLFDHAALEAQITDLLTAEATRPASRAAAAAAAARQRNSNSRAADKAKATANSRSKVPGDPASMSFPLSLAATQAYPLPPPPIGYPPQPSENEPAEPDETMSESGQHHTANPSLPSEHAASAANVLDAAAAHNPGQPQNFADITDILAHLSAHLESAAAAAAVAAGHLEAAHPTVGSSGAEDDDDSPHEGRDDDDDDEVTPRVTPGERAGAVGEQEDFSRPFVCDVPNCGKGFGRKSDLARHSRIHSGERPYPCDQPGCGKSFIQRSALNVHRRVHTGEKPHTCEYAGCDKTFGDSSSLARHRRTHTGRRPYKCDNPTCDKTFTRRTTLNRHMRVHMPGFDPHSRPAKRRRTEDEFSDMPAIGSFITPRAALPGGVRPVPQMSNSALISLGPSASGSSSNGPPASAAPQPEGSSQTTTPATHPEPSAWTEQVNGVERHARPAAVGIPMSNIPINTQQMDEGEVYPEDWVQDIDGEGDSEEQVTDKSPQDVNRT